MSEFFSAVFQFFTVDLWVGIESAIVWTMLQFTLLSIKLAISSSERMGQYIVAMITEIDLAQPIVLAIDALPEDVKGILLILNFPTALTTIIGSYVFALSLKIIFRR